MTQLTPEQQAREHIDDQLDEAGWVIQNHKELNLTASAGVAIREFPLTTGTADYLLFIDGKAAGVVEAKKEGTILSPVETQSSKYEIGLPDGIPSLSAPLPFVYEYTIFLYQ